MLKLKVYIVEIETKHSKILLLFGTKGILLIKIYILVGVDCIICLFDLIKYIGNNMLVLIEYGPTSLNPSLTQYNYKYYTITIYKQFMQLMPKV